MRFRALRKIPLMLVFGLTLGSTLSFANENTQNLVDWGVPPEDGVHDQYWPAWPINEHCAEAIHGLSGQIQNAEGLQRAAACAGFLRGFIEGVGYGNRMLGPLENNVCIASNTTDEDLIEKLFSKSSSGRKKIGFLERVVLRKKVKEMFPDLTEDEAIYRYREHSYEEQKKLPGSSMSARGSSLARRLEKNFPCPEEQELKDSQHTGRPLWNMRSVGIVRDANLRESAQSLREVLARPDLDTSTREAWENLLKFMGESPTEFDSARLACSSLLDSNGVTMDEYWDCVNKKLEKARLGLK